MSSPLKTNTIKIQNLINQINALPEAENLDSEISTQTTLISEQDVKIAELAEILSGKAGGSGGYEYEDEGVIISNVNNISSSAYFENDNLMAVAFPVCTTIGYSAFRECSSLTTAIFPAATTIGSNAFDYCTNLTTVSFPKVTSIGNEAFQLCSSLTTASFPATTTIGSSAFDYCNNLTTASFPATTTIGSSAFNHCESLTTVDFPVATTIGNYAFCYCISLTTAIFPAATTIGSNAFDNCYELKSLYLTGSSMCELSNSNAFNNTPIGGYSTYAGTFGSIYVPASLLTAYQTATNWTYFSNRFVTFTNGLITFTISGTEYQAEEGMTWYDWCNSDYNTIEAYVTSGTITFTKGTGKNKTYRAIGLQDGTYVISTDKIIDKYEYIDLKS